MTTTISLHVPADWPFTSPVVPARFMPSGRAYNPDADGLVAAVQNDIPALLGFGFYVVGSSASPITALSDVDVSAPADSDVLTWVEADERWKNKPASGGGGTPGSPPASLQYNNAGAFGGTALQYNGTAFSTQMPFSFVDASVLGAAIVNAGTGGTPGAATVTGTTGTGTKFQAAVTITNSVTAAVVNNAGDGSGTPGPVTITGVTGTGTPFQATGTVDGAGLLAGALTVTVHGSYTVNPTTTNEAVTSDAGLVGATVNLTLAGAVLSSVDSISVAGSYTVPPTDPANEPVTGGGLTGAVLALGMNFAPSIVGSDATSGYGYDNLGQPVLTIAGAPVLSLDGTGGGGFNNTFLRVSSAADNSIELKVDGVPDQNGMKVEIQLGSRFTIYNPNDDPLFDVHDPNGAPGVGGVIIFGDAASPRISSAFDQLKIGTSFGTYISLDGSGNTNILNGVLTVATAIAISALPASPVAGMIATVNDANTPTVGLAVVSGGSAKAVVCYGGTQWTVISV